MPIRIWLKTAEKVGDRVIRSLAAFAEDEKTNLGRCHLAVGDRACPARKRGVFVQGSDSTIKEAVSQHHAFSGVVPNSCAISLSCRPSAARNTRRGRSRDLR